MRAVTKVVLGIITQVAVLGSTSHTAMAISPDQGCRQSQDCGSGDDGSGGKGGPSNNGYDFMKTPDGAQFTVTRNEAGVINSATAVGTDGIRRTLTIYPTTWDLVTDSNGDYSTTSGTSRIQYGDSAGESINVMTKVLANGWAAGVTVTTYAHYFSYGIAGDGATLSIDGTKHWGTKPQMLARISANTIPEFSKMNYFNNIFALIWNEKHHAGQVPALYDAPSSISYLGDGILGAIGAAIAGMSGPLGVGAALLVPIIDAWQNDPAVQSGASWIADFLLCSGIQVVDTFINPQLNTVADPGTLYNQLSCRGF